MSSMRCGTCNGWMKNRTKTDASDWAIFLNLCMFYQVQISKTLCTLQYIAQPDKGRYTWENFKVRVSEKIIEAKLKLCKIITFLRELSPLMIRLEVNFISKQQLICNDYKLIYPSVGN